MNTERFQIKRDDGRSDTQVIMDLAAEAEPGTLFRFKEMIQALSKGAARKYGPSDVCSAVNRSENRMLSEQSRTLMNVRGVGYKVALACEHVGMSKDRRARSNTLLRKGLNTLRHVRWDEMDENQRAAHEGQLLVMSAVVQMQDQLKDRQDKADALIKKLLDDR